VCWVLWGPGDDEVIAEKVVSARVIVYDALIAGEFLGVGEVRNA
jgi:hypothetical protein